MLRTILYAIARSLGDLKAISKGPKAVAVRSARKYTYKRVARAVNRSFKIFGR